MAPTTSVLDNFNAGANQNLTARSGWGSGNYWGFASLQTNGTPTAAQPPAISTWYANYWDTSWDDQEVWITIESVGSIMYWMLATRSSAGYNASEYELMINVTGLAWSLDLYVGGSYIGNLGGGAISACNAGDSFALQSVGDEHSIWYRASGGSWSLIDTITDATLASGRIGVQGRYNLGGSAGSITEFAGGPLGPIVHNATFSSGSSSGSAFSGEAIHTPVVHDATLASDADSASTFAPNRFRNGASIASDSTSTSTFDGEAVSVHPVKDAAFSSAATSTSTLAAQRFGEIVAVAAGITPDRVLGCGIASAEVWERGGARRVLDLPGVSAASWGRVLGDTSSGEVTLPGQALSSDPECCAILRTVRPWKHELHIYRDGELGWCGPITSMKAAGDGLVIRARDLSAWLDRRVVHKTHIYGGQGAGQGDTLTTTIFRELVEDALEPDPSPNITLELGEVSGVFAQGNYTPGSFRLVGPLIRELAKGSVDWYQINRVLRYSGGGVTMPSVAGGGLDVTGLCVANPGFETNTSNWTISGAGWTVARDVTKFKTGAASGKISHAGDPPPAGFVVSQPLTELIPGKTYTAEMWVEAGTLATHWWAYWGGGNPLKITIGDPPSGEHRYQGVSSADVAYAALQNLGTWIVMSVTFKATATSHTLYMDTRGVSGSPCVFRSLFIDALRLVLKNPDADMVIPTGSAQAASLVLTDDDLAVPAELDLSGLNQENRSIVSNQQAGGDAAFYGEAPDPPWELNTTGPGLTPEQDEYGLLEGSTTAAGADASSAAAQAAQRNYLYSSTPLLLDKIVIGPGAGVTMDDLVPGVLIEVRLDRSCLAVRRVMLLRSLEVQASGDGAEQVTLTFEPAGGE